MVVVGGVASPSITMAKTESVDCLDAKDDELLVAVIELDLLHAYDYAYVLSQKSSSAFTASDHLPLV